MHSLSTPDLLRRARGEIVNTGRLATDTSIHLQMRGFDPADLEDRLLEAIHWQA